MRTSVTPVTARKGIVCLRLGAQPVRHLWGGANLAVFLLGLATLWSHAEVRAWKDTSGHVVQAEYVSSTPTTVTFKMTNGQLATVDRARLSKEDLDFVGKQTAGASATAASPALPAKAGKEGAPPFFQVQVDPKKWPKTSPQKLFGITGYDFESQVETPHFIITAAKKVRESHLHTYAEVSERLYHQITQNIPGVASAFEGKKLAIWIAPSKEEYAKIGPSLELLGEVSPDWSNSSMNWVQFSKNTRDQFSLMRLSRGFRTDYEPNFQSSVRWPMRIHFLASDIVADGLPRFSGNGTSTDMFDTCYAYYIEGLICGKIETKITFSLSSNKVEGFEKGWETAVKRLIGKSSMRPSIDKFTTMQASSSEPSDLGFGYGLMKYIFSSPKRTAQFNTMLEKCRTASVSPSGLDYANALGAESTSAFDQLWLEYLKSPAF